jgi:SnoaL-like domain
MSAHAAFRAAAEAGDHAAMVATLAPDAVLRSPVSFKPFEGREAVSRLFGILLETFEDFRYTDEFDADGKAALVFAARVGDRELEGVDLFRFDADGQVAELTVMVRPLSAAIALAEAVGPKLAAA